jgi:hypothetical protein
MSGSEKHFNLFSIVNFHTKKIYGVGHRCQGIVYKEINVFFDCY